MPTQPARPLNWSATHRALLRAASRLSFEMAFRRLARRDPALAPWCDPGALLAMLHADRGNLDAKDAVLASLVRAAQGPWRESDTAQTVLILALWPGLDAIHGRLRKHFRHEAERLTADLLGGLAVGIRTLDLRRVSRIAATLTRNIERDLRRQLKKEWATAAKLVELTEETVMMDPDRVAELRASAAMLDSPDLMGSLGKLVGKDAELVIRVAILGETQAEAAQALELTHDAARKRYQRAMLRLRQHHCPAMSHSEPPGGVSVVRDADGPGDAGVTT